MSHQEIRDALTQKRSQYAWEAYLKYRTVASRELKRVESEDRPREIIGKTFRDSLKSGGEGPLLVVIPAGRFQMGSPSNESMRSENEGPQHEVIIAQPLAIGVHAVTFDDYDRYTGSKNARPGSRSLDSHPVRNVSWDDAQKYCQWLSEQTGHTYRLPSEAEWEYACRAGTLTVFSFGDQITPEQVNYDGNSPYAGGVKGLYRQSTVPVRSLPPNPWGLYEMHGNVWEWCQDHWHGDYQGAPNDGSTWETGGSSSRVLRGGSWYDYGRNVRSASRIRLGPGFRNGSLGFRVCREGGEGQMVGHNKCCCKIGK